MEFFYILLILLVVTRTFGEIAERVGQPALVGELIAGISLGMVGAHWPGLIPELQGLSDSPVFGTITDLGMFFLMLYAGIEMQPHKMAKHSAAALAVATGGMVLPLAAGAALGYLFLPTTEVLTAQALFIGTALAITAVPATVRILLDLGQLNSRIGQTIVSAAVFDDVLSLVLLAWLTALIDGSGPPTLGAILLLAGKIVLFFVVTGLIGVFLFPRGGRLATHLRQTEHEVSAMLVVAFAFAVLAELLAMHFIVGAFVAGLFFGKQTIDPASYERVRDRISGMTFGFLAPIFFASIGLHLDLAALGTVPVFLTLLIVVAFAGKIVGAGTAAAMAGFDRRDATIIGVGMSPRGAVELIIAEIALTAGLFQYGGDDPVVANLFSAVVVMAVVTTVASPILLQRTFRRRVAAAKTTKPL